MDGKNGEKRRFSIYLENDRMYAIQLQLNTNRKSHMHYGINSDDLD